MHPQSTRALPFPSPSRRPACLAWGGKSRIDIESFTVRSYTSQGDFTGTKFPQPYPPAENRMDKPAHRGRGQDGVGRFVESEYTVANGPVRGRWTLKTYPAMGLALVSAEASNADPATWWMGCHFGLSGEGTVVTRLRLPGFSAGLCTFMNEEWWSHPAFPSRPDDVTSQTRFLAWREKDGTYGCVLPLSGGEFTSHLRGVPGAVEVRSCSYDDACAKAAGPCFLAAFGDDPYETVDRATTAAARLLGTARPREEKTFPEPLEYLGWCTWDAFYREVNEKGVLEQLRSFQRKGIPVRSLLLDDGWYAMRDNQMLDCFADRKKFPQGLRSLVKKVKADHRIRFVGAWHALTGYWMGIHPEHRLPKVMKDVLLHHKNLPPAPPHDGVKALRFYGAWHRYLRGEGIDYVKVDGQSHALRYTRNEVPLAKGAASQQKALQESVRLNFGDRMINCMSMSPDQCWNYRRSNVTRSSDDYMINGVEGDPLDHARINAYNSFWMSPLSWADWDMFWSSSPNAVLHQALRAVSGGPVYVSDQVGTSRAEVLNPLCLPDGRLLRCDGVGRPTVDALFRDPARTEALKIWNRAGDAGVLCLVRSGPKTGETTCAFRPDDIPNLADGDFAVWNFHSRQGRRMGRKDVWKVRLKGRGVSLFTATPIRNGFAAVGIVGKLVAPKTVSSVRVDAREARVALLTGGTFAAYSRRLPVAVRVGGKDLPYEYRNGWLIASVPGDGASELRVVF